MIKNTLLFTLFVSLSLCGMRTVPNKECILAKDIKSICKVPENKQIELEEYIGLLANGDCIKAYKLKNIFSEPKENIYCYWVKAGEEEPISDSYFNLLKNLYDGE